MDVTIWIKLIVTQQKHIWNVGLSMLLKYHTSKPQGMWNSYLKQKKNSSKKDWLYELLSIGKVTHIEYKKNCT